MADNKIPAHVQQQLIKLKLIRQTLGLSQRVVGDILGAGQHTVSDWETSLKCPNAEHQKRLSAWLEEAIERLGAEETQQAIPEVDVTQLAVSQAPKRLIPEVRERIVEQLKAGRTHKEIKADTGVGLARISKVRHEEAIPVRPPESREADYIYKLWDTARGQTRSFDPSKLPHNEKISFGMSLVDVMMWLRRYIERHLADIADAKKLTEEVKKSFWR